MQDAGGQGSSDQAEVGAIRAEEGPGGGAGATDVPGVSRVRVTAGHPAPSQADPSYRRDDDAEQETLPETGH